MASTPQPRYGASHQRRRMRRRVERQHDRSAECGTDGPATSCPPMPWETRTVLDVIGNGVNIRHCDSRSLIFERLANPTLKENDRRKFFENHLSRVDDSSIDVLRRRRLKLIEKIGEKRLLMELRGRLVVNASGGVMENAGLCLDRFSNLPFIPGSAVKGCARRAALHFLKGWVDSEKSVQQQQVNSPLERYETREDMFLDILLIFGWVDQDWKPGQDLAWAWGASGPWEDKRNEVAKALLARLGRPIKEKPEPWKQLFPFQGLIGFLSAWPLQSPKPDIELDVVTCHHMRYYRGEKGYEQAFDNESPIPVVFPAVAAHHVFEFGVFPVRRPVPGVDVDELVEAAVAWLKVGLEVFGVGAKTAAGYGWFVYDEEADRRRAEEEQRRRKQAEQERIRREEERRRAEEEKKRLEQMTPVERIAFELSRTPDEQLAAMVKSLPQKDADTQRAFLKMLREHKPHLWKKWKKAKKERDAQRAEILRKIAEELGEELP